MVISCPGWFYRTSITLSGRISFREVHRKETMRVFICLALSVSLASCGFLGGGGGGGGGHGGGFGGGDSFGNFGSTMGGHEDNAALSAVGLARLLGGGASWAGMGYGGATYTISGPTQEIRSLHKIQTTSQGGQILSRSGGGGSGGQAKIIIIKGGAGGGGGGGGAKGWH